MRPPVSLHPIVIIGLLGSLCIATSAFASTLIRKSFDRQVVAADVFVIGVGLGGKARCSTDDVYVEMCTGVRVLQVLKGEAPAEISLSGGIVAGSDSGCCEAGQVYAMALSRRGGVRYESTNSSLAIYNLGAQWDIRPPPASRVPDDARIRPLSFDQQVVAADAFVVARGTGDRHQCRSTAFPMECETFVLVRAMKGTVPASFEAPSSIRIHDVGSGRTENWTYRYGEAGQMYALALSEGPEGFFAPVSGDAVHRLSEP